MFGEVNLKGIESAGCDVSLVEISQNKTATGTAVITVSNEGIFKNKIFYNFNFSKNFIYIALR